MEIKQFGLALAIGFLSFVTGCSSQVHEEMRLQIDSANGYYFMSGPPLLS